MDRRAEVAPIYSINFVIIERAHVQSLLTYVFMRSKAPAAEYSIGHALERKESFFSNPRVLGGFLVICRITYLVFWTA